MIQPKTFTSEDAHLPTELGYKGKASAITFEVLSQMALKDSIVAAIIQTRVNEVKMFTQAQPDRYSYGFKLNLRDEEKIATKAEKEDRLVSLQKDITLHELYFYIITDTYP